MQHSTNNKFLEDLGDVDALNTFSHSLRSRSGGGGNRTPLKRKKKSESLAKNYEVQDSVQKEVVYHSPYKKHNAAPPPIEKAIDEELSVEEGIRMVIANSYHHYQRSQVIAVLLWTY